ncbi:MAG: 2-succinyl-5-enolpyruvyl-6-hydroxy-3-cyclohexene-1-carboxylic-acid synthase [Mycobacteriales bacterium]
MNPSTALATVMVDELIRGGVREAVLSPGSRSAPFAFALAAADTAGRLRLHVRIDERSAGFLALGLAKSGRPVVVVTTSGTAVANLHPALLEASHAGVPLVVLSADRPGELRGSGANQTTDQTGLFGSGPRLFVDVAAPDRSLGQDAGSLLQTVPYWRATVCRVLAAATGVGGPAGPVHVNVGLREPLVPDQAGETGTQALAGRPDGRPWTATAAMCVAGEAPAAGRPGALTLEPRTLVLVGDLPAGRWGQLVADLADEQGWPMVTEPSSGAAWAGGLPHGALLLGDQPWLAAHRPDRVLAVGHLTLGRAVSRLLADPGVDVDVVGDGPPWPDPGHRARQVYPWAVLERSLGARSTVDAQWRPGWQRAAGRASNCVESVLTAAGWPTGLAVARTVAAALPAGAVLVVGASNGVRDVQLAATPGPVDIVSSRGLAGIDGTLSVASGVALDRAQPTYALVGDLTFLHDAGGLVRGPAEPQPNLTVVVVNDDGGGIFGLLEPGAPQHAGVFERVFGTPHGVDFGALCAATATSHVLVRDERALRDHLGVRPDGVKVVEVRVDRRGHAALHAQLRSTLAQALAG